MTLLHHPALGVTRDFPEQTIEIWQRSGWEAVDAHATESPTPVDEQPPDEGDQPPENEEES